MGRVQKDRELARRRKRREKLKKLRKKYAEAQTPAERAEIEAKVRKISPFAELAPAEGQTAS